MTNFAEFFKALWEREPFPWQTMLAERAAAGDWPKAIALPPASGKTACLDAAVYALAATADNPERRMPRRIWFVVDRRIVVDEAHERARKIAGKLKEPKHEALREVAVRLKTLNINENERPALAVARLRGGVWQADEWARVPCQPTIICSTVDQLGSALLFRPHGHGDRTASIYAGLAAHDSLILLDEAHCAVPFLQTLEWIRHYRSRAWAAQAIETPFHFGTMSATPPDGTKETEIFPGPDERQAALNHPVLEKRVTARKLAVLATPVKGEDEKFAGAAANRAIEFAGRGKQRIAVMVNRVATASAIYDLLNKRKDKNALDIVLLTGRMRPVDRDKLMGGWEQKLKSGSTLAPERPLIVVATQCLEVGADFSFDALVTEFASIDALRQRFGRLDRLGDLNALERTAYPDGDPAPGAAILIRDRDTYKPKDDRGDPIYGPAIYETWTWLNEKAHKKEKESVVDFGINALDERLRTLDSDGRRKLLAPTAEAPILMPAYLDLLCQTAPRPNPDPDVALFLHGKQRGAPQVRLVARNDLPAREDKRQRQEAWVDLLSIVPPTSPEMWTVPLYALVKWLSGGAETAAGGDVEGVPELPEEDQRTTDRSLAKKEFLLWRGRDHSELSQNPKDIRPDDVVVLSATRVELGGLAQTLPESGGLGPDQLDVAERAFLQARGRAVLRITPALLNDLRGVPGIRQLLELAETELDVADVAAELANLREDAGRNPEAPSLPEAIATFIEKVGNNFTVEQHPSSGVILIGKERIKEADLEDDAWADEDDLTSRSDSEVLLKDHTAAVRAIAEQFASLCAPELSGPIATGADCHDLGKLDYRFRVMLCNGDEEAAANPPLAKSARLSERRRRRTQIRDELRLPTGFRHEFLSMQLAEKFGLVGESGNSELALHLIASHHGHARPFAPVVNDLLDDSERDRVSLAKMGLEKTLTATDRRGQPPHRLDSGVADRFWRLTRRYGWWGLTYLEAIFRLADGEASRRTAKLADAETRFTPSERNAVSHHRHTLPLDALDGSNPLAFLAALGTLRVLERECPDLEPELAWQMGGTCWNPVVRLRCLAQPPSNPREMVCDAIKKGLNLGFKLGPEKQGELELAKKSFEQARKRFRDKEADLRKRKLMGRERDEARQRETASLVADMESKRRVWLAKLRSSSPFLEMALGQRINVPAGEFRGFCELAVGSGDRWAMAQLAHFASDGCWTRTFEVEPTVFSFINGSGYQFFLDTARELVMRVTRQQVFAALFEPWCPADRKYSMRWNPCEDRRYALMSADPTSPGNEPRTIWAANLLGYAGLGLLPSAPTRRGLGTTGVSQADNRAFTWPIWDAFLSCSAVSSLLELSDLTAPKPPASKLKSMGIHAIFRSERIAVGSGPTIKLNFTPARSL